VRLVAAGDSNLSVFYAKQDFPKNLFSSALRSFSGYGDVGAFS
jgi:hypothetical protein